MKKLYFALLAFTVIINTACGITTVPRNKAHKTIGSTKTNELDLPFNLLVWNIKKGGEPNWNSDFSIFSSDKDIILIQEHMDEPNVFEEVNKLGGVWDFAYTWTKNNKGTGTSTYSRVQPLVSVIIRTDNGEPIVNTKKSAIATKYKLAGLDQELLVINIHAINFVLPKTFKMEIDKILMYISNHKGPMIFGGDFNTNMDSKKQYLEYKLNEIGLKEVEYQSGFPKLIMGKQLDFVFYRGLKVITSEVKNNVISSDHDPIFVRFDI